MSHVLNVMGEARSQLLTPVVSLRSGAANAPGGAGSGRLGNAVRVEGQVSALADQPVMFRASRSL